MTNRRALRAERRGRSHGDFTDAANKAVSQARACIARQSSAVRAESSNWDKGGFFTK